MARNLAKAGLLQGVWNRSHNKAQALAAELGCIAPTDPAVLAADCDVLVLCVSADRDVLDVLASLELGLKSGTLVIDCSTVSAATAREAAKKIALRGARFLDCPVSGGVEGAKNGRSLSCVAVTRPISKTPGRYSRRWAGRFVTLGRTVQARQRRLLTKSCAQASFALLVRQWRLLINKVCRSSAWSKHLGKAQDLRGTS
jgi:3-hydroxyisobutyrate dehydrogenase-like beta-hydroxyacid dehydrogenase